MLIFKQNFLKLKSELKVDQCFNLFVVIVIGCIFVLSYLALLRPISRNNINELYNSLIRPLILKLRIWLSC